MWDLPGPGLEPVSPAFAGGFLTTVPPGKPLIFFFKAALASLNNKLPRRWHLHLVLPNGFLEVSSVRMATPPQALDYIFALI